MQVSETTGGDTATTRAVASEAVDEDAAWVSVETGLREAVLRAMAGDVERMLRINPLLDEIRVEWDAVDKGRLKLRNLANERDVDVAISVTRTTDRVDLVYAGGLKSRTSFRVEPGDAGARLVVTDVYGGASTREEREARLGEVDTSLNAWGRALAEHFHQWQRWSWLPPWRWYMRRVWLPMRPSARRIVFMILAISLFEIATIVVLGAAFAVWRLI